MTAFLFLCVLAVLGAGLAACAVAAAALALVTGSAYAAEWGPFAPRTSTWPP
ncbi:hypothetical protein ACIBEA_30900 [Streptomyces sp. NPDC051555]|uniref:hypothetical protein n=1 Tax=Streptomyces sp. NPDC051555 TaxID=3365657 RepID=UPI00379EBDED